LLHEAGYLPDCQCSSCDGCNCKQGEDANNAMRRATEQDEAARPRALEKCQNWHSDWIRRPDRRSSEASARRRTEIRRSGRVIGHHGLPVWVRSGMRRTNSLSPATGCGRTRVGVRCLRAPASAQRRRHVRLLACSIPCPGGQRRLIPRSQSVRRGANNLRLPLTLR
jgi:hypothetical protein